MISNLLVLSIAAPLLLLLLLLPATTRAQNDNFPDSLSVLLTEPFQCNMCAAASQSPGTLKWCLCCFWNCSGYRDACVAQHGFCGKPSMCGSIQICDLFGGAPPDGAVMNNAQSFFEDDGITFKQCHGVVPPPKCSSQTCPAGVGDFTQIGNGQCSQDTLHGNTAHVGGEMSGVKMCQVPLIDGNNDAYKVAKFTAGSCTVEPSYCYCEFNKGSGKAATTAYSRCGSSPLSPPPSVIMPHTQWTPAPDTVLCDDSAWVCDSMPTCSCVRDECERTSGSVHGHCSNHPAWPCTGKEDSICVCNDDKTKACSPRTPAPTQARCSADHSCVTQDADGGECGCDVKCIMGYCQTQNTGNDAACHTGYVCVDDKCVPKVTPAPPSSPAVPTPVPTLACGAKFCSISTTNGRACNSTGVCQAGNCYVGSKDGQECLHATPQCPDKYTRKRWESDTHPCECDDCWCSSDFDGKTAVKCTAVAVPTPVPPTVPGPTSAPPTVSGPTPQPPSPPASCGTSTRCTACLTQPPGTTFVGECISTGKCILPTDSLSFPCDTTGFLDNCPNGPIGSCHCKLSTVACGCIDDGSGVSKLCLQSTPMPPSAPSPAPPTCGSCGFPGGSLCTTQATGTQVNGTCSTTGTSSVLCNILSVTGLVAACDNTGAPANNCGSMADTRSCSCKLLATSCVCTTTAGTKLCSTPSAPPSPTPLPSSPPASSPSTSAPASSPSTSAPASSPSTSAPASLPSTSAPASLPSTSAPASSPSTSAPPPTQDHVCGNGIVVFPETCDAGMGGNGNSPSQPCTGDCKSKSFACCNAAGQCASHVSIGNIVNDQLQCAHSTNTPFSIVYGSAGTTVCGATTCCGNGLIDKGVDVEQCDLGASVNGNGVSHCTAACKLREIHCCNGNGNGNCLQFTPNALTGALPALCIAQCTVATRCTAPLFFDVGTACPLTCPTCVASANCGVKPGCQAGLYEHMSCESSKDCGGETCVRVEDACQTDSECADCAATVSQIAPRKNRCMPCLLCTPEQFAATRGLTSPNALVCCSAGNDVPVKVFDNNKKKRDASWDAVGCLSNEAPQTCRPQLSCMCNTCVDSCDFNISSSALPPREQALLAGDQAGIEVADQAKFQTNQGFTTPVPAATQISEAMCTQLYEHACHLHPGTDIKTVTQPHNMSTTLQLYVKEFFDVFNVHASERAVTVTYTYPRNEALDGFTSTIVDNVYYLIDARDDCCQPNITAPLSIDIEASSDTRQDVVRFLVPYVGNYILVHAAAIRHVVPVTQAYLNALAQIRCINGTIGINFTAPTCPATLCNAQSCVDSRDCNSTACSHDACDGDYHRCILAEPLLDRHAFLRNQVATHDEKFADRNFLPSGDSIDTLTHQVNKGDANKKLDSDEDLCGGAKNGEKCILHTNNANDPLQCQLGTCTNSVCTANTDNAALFECDCKCPRQCKNQPDCERQCTDAHAADAQRTDGKFWTGFCLKGEGSCVCRLEAKKTTTSTLSTTTTSTAAGGATTPTATTATAAGGTARAQSRETIRLVGYQSKLTTLVTPDRVAEITEPITAASLLAVMDAGEVRRAQLALDVSGSQSSAPLCADVEQRSIVVSATAHKQAIDATCARVDIAHKCLDGAASAILSGHMIVDRAVRGVTAAARSAQAAHVLDAFENACCALIYFNALSDSCGTPPATLVALDSLRVVRATDGVGPMCAAFDDGHVDRDVNELVVEQRLVEVRDSSNRLVALNIYVLPLARGGGYKVSYAISLRGASIQSVDNGANAACSERARAVMRETFDPASLASVLRGRKQFPEGTRVAMLLHVEHTVDDNSALPTGVRSARCTTLGGAKDDSACARTDAGDVAIIDDLRLALPPVEGDAIDQLLATGVRVDQSTNTHHATPSVRARFSSSSVIVLPPGGGDTSALSAANVRFVLRNEDCGAAVLLLTPAEQRTLSSEPIALTIPPHSCPAWRWANEGVRLIQSNADETRVCRGGTESGIAQCANDADLTCTTAGGDCAQAASVAGVPYRTAKAHYACKVCFTDALCANEPTCTNHPCCQDQILHWYRYPSADLVYAGHTLNVAEEILQTKSSSSSSSSDE